MKVIIKQALVAASAMAVTGAAFAAGDPGVEAITALSAQAQTYITAAFAVAVLVAGGFWGIKMMKKAFGKAG
ncbi:major coat protein [Janthinobacterium sp. LS2A]|uniref:major coat protein n=1 Tax=Janthinobacterium sp. LS2A TaxID=3118590 RepID=UPI002F929738